MNQPTRNHRSNQGFIALEVMLACALLALGLLPVFGMMTAGTRQSAFSEYALFAAPRAKRILDAYLTMDYRYFASLGENAELDVKDVLSGSEPPMPEEYLAKLDRDGYTERAEWRSLDNGLGVLTVTIEWTFPADGQARADRPHLFILKRVISQPDQSMCTDLQWSNRPVQS